MRIAVFGMGHVGLVTAALLAEAGHTVTGVDVDRERLAMLNQGQVPFSEPGLEEIVRTQMRSGRLAFSGCGAETVGVSDIVLICVGTPTDAQGNTDLSAVYGALAVIADGVIVAGIAPVVVLRSTVPPTALDHIHDYMKQRGLPHLCVNPEFLREGSAVADFRYAPFAVIGAAEVRARDMVEELGRPYGRDDVVIARTDCKTAMLVKYVSNAWHALKVTFANEIGDIAAQVDVDGRAVMEIMAWDRVLNISPAYLRPGAPFGGSCLPKDLRALLHMAWGETPSVLQAVVYSNDKRMWRVVDRAMATGARKFGIIGVSFKAGTDDVRESPWMMIADRLIQAGGEVRMYDPDVRADAYEVLTGDLDALLQWAECVIVGKSELLPQGTTLPPCVIYGDGGCS